MRRVVAAFLAAASTVVCLPLLVAPKGRPSNPKAPRTHAMGDDFDLGEFHDRVLENGTIPLTQLRAHIEAWVADHVTR